MRFNTSPAPDVNRDRSVLRVQQGQTVRKLQPAASESRTVDSTALSILPGEVTDIVERFVQLSDNRPGLSAFVVAVFENH